MDKKQVIIIGGGASGLLAAITATRAGAKVIILEHMNKPGKKILATGNGKCNLTNLNQDKSNYRSNNPSFAGSALQQFSVPVTLRFFTALGIYTKNKNNHIYPHSEQAASVLEVLLAECEHLKIVIKGQEQIKSVKKIDRLFLVKTDTWTYKSDSLIIATGSKAAPAFGSDGSGYHLSALLGHTIIPPLQALVPLKPKEPCYTKLSGIRADVKLSLYINETLHSAEEGELQISTFGISGIPTFQLSRFAVKALKNKKRVVITIDFAKDFTEAALAAYIRTRIEHTPYKRMSQLFIGFINPKLSEVILNETGISPKKGVQDLEMEEILAIVKLLKSFPATIIDCHTFEQAQVCQGGVDTAEINAHTMESKLVPGLYFSGEVIDIDGACGGYNLQWAWSSGYVAGKNAGTKEV